MFEVSVHRATTALNLRNRQFEGLINEAMQVCVHCETIFKAQRSNCIQLSSEQKRQHITRAFGAPPYSSFQLSRVSAFVPPEGWGRNS